MLLNPAIPTPRKRSIMTELIARLDNLVPPVAKLAILLAERDRLGLLPDILASYRARLLDHLGVIEASVTTAHPLAPERTTAIEERLAAVSGRTVTMTTAVDPQLLGGFVARLGTTVYDASVARNLERMRLTLLER